SETVFAVLQVHGRREGEDFERAQTLLLKSRPILKLALSKPEVKELEVLRGVSDPLAWLELSLRVDFAEDTQTLRISLCGRTAADLAAIVNAVTDVYLDQLRAATERRVQRLEDEYLARDRKLEDELKDLEKEPRPCLPGRRSHVESEHLTLAMLRVRIAV